MTDIVGLTLNYRDTRRTLRCLQSPWSEGIGHVLVWDNSGDGGASVAELKHLVGADPWMELVISPENLGFAKAVNRGLKWLEERHPGNAVLLLNNDAELREGGWKKCCGHYMRPRAPGWFIPMWTMAAESAGPSTTIG